jgi:hypothetical protein
LMATESAAEIRRSLRMSQVLSFMERSGKFEKIDFNLVQIWDGMEMNYFPVILSCVLPRIPWFLVTMAIPSSHSQVEIGTALLLLVF